MNTNIEKFNTVIDKNTYFFYNADFEYGYEKYMVQKSVKIVLIHQ